MNNFPDFSAYHYQITQELGHNLTGGRVTYKATYLPTGNNVVIKQFQFSRIDSWKATEYDAYEQEIKVLRHLNHPGIPKYLDNFETSDGFCLVQEYLNAQSLAIPRSWQLEEIKQIALSILDILVYLQSQTPSVIHRDIKPENILIDEQLNVYLVDFGFARIGGTDVTASSMVKGTMGFMPPEQLFNRELTTASDLYGLGATLVCLLTGVKSVDIGSLIDSDYCIHFRHLVPPLQRGWISWLEKIVKPLPKERYSSAIEALKALEPIDLTQLPKVRTSSNIIEFQGQKWGEKLTETITVTNPIPDTILSGNWEVAPHSSDPPHTPYEHSWIKIEPSKFENNLEKCKVVIDTSKLLENTVYERQLLLHTNSSVETYPVQIQVHTGSLPKLQGLNYLTLGALFITSLFTSFIFYDCISLFNQAEGNRSLYLILVWFLLLILIITEQLLITSKTKKFQDCISSILGSILCSFLGIVVGLIIGSVLGLIISYQLSFILGIVSGTIVGAKYGFKINFAAIVITHLALIFLIGSIILSLITNFISSDLMNLIPSLVIGIIALTIFYLLFISFIGFSSVILSEFFKIFSEAQITNNIAQKDAVIITILTTALGTVIGIILPTALRIIKYNWFSQMTFLQLVLIFLSIFTVVLIGMLFIKKIKEFKKQNKIIDRYSHQKENFINP